MDTLGIRIRAARGTTSQDAFAKQIGVSKGSLGFYERDENLPNTDVVLKICSATGVSVKWLMTGEGPMRQGGAIEPSEESRGMEMVRIPRVEACLSAGTGSLVTEDNIIEYLSFPAVLVRHKGPIDQMVFMNVAGNSMEPAISDGDLALINQNDKDLNPGNLYAVGVEEEIFLKIVDSRLGKLYLASYNEDYPPIKIDTNGDMADTVRILGRCIWTGRYW